MLKLIKESLSSIAGVGLYPSISFTLFFVFFALVTFWALKADKKHLQHLAALPLDEETIEPHHDH